jgi:hypothetical protein
MFRILSTHPHEAVLDQAIQIIDRVQALRSNALDLILYDSAKFFVAQAIMKPKKGSTHVGGEISDNKNTASASAGALATESRALGSDSSSGATVETADKAVARFEPLAMAVIAYPTEPWRQPERTRKSRLDLGLALTEGPLQEPAALAAIFEPWLAEERSRPLHATIERILQACQQKA